MVGGVEGGDKAGWREGGFFGSQGAELPGRIMSASGPGIRHFIRANLLSSGQCM